MHSSNSNKICSINSSKMMFQILMIQISSNLTMNMEIRKRVPSNINTNQMKCNFNIFNKTNRIKMDVTLTMMIMINSINMMMIMVMKITKSLIKKMKEKVKEKMKMTQTIFKINNHQIMIKCSRI